MDIITTPPYEELQEIYKKNFSLPYLSEDLSDKLALISFCCYITHELQKKKPDVTHYQVLRKVCGEFVSEDTLKALAVICSDFGYGCTKFPTFNLSNKEIMVKIRELVNLLLPF